MRRARLTAAIAAAIASLTATGVQAQEANAWDVEDIIGRAETTSIAQLSRQQVLAELQGARQNGTYHAGNEGSVPQDVLERRAMANQREGERIARAYRDEAERVARMNTPAPSMATAPAANEAVTTTPVAPVESAVVIIPGQPPATTDPASAATTRPMPSDSGTPPPTPDVRPNEEMASDSRQRPEDLLNNRVPPRGDGPPVAPSNETAAPGARSGGTPRDSEPLPTTR